ncbi:transcription factor bHLH130 [Sesamum indicum]|uniref:Transcription factor bHLH130 n=1 Tax=Sesamum indicum TaxID=4182 RepID=A0A6I9TRH4_SESIN|nr:transcription factor bHLH130 [Sesamum indicum]
MFRSETTSRNSSSSFLLSNPGGNQSSFKHVSAAEGDFFKSRDQFMGSDLFHNQSQQSCGLARFRSAPSSFLAALLDSTTDNSSSGDESEALLMSAFMNGPPDLNHKGSNNNGGNQVLHYQQHMKQEAGVESDPRPGFVNGQMGYETAVSGGGGAIVGSYSVGMESQVHVAVSSNSSNLVRQSSSPAGFFNGYGVMGEVGNYRVHNQAKANASASNGMSNHMNFSSAPCSSSRYMPSIPENVNESISTCNPENGQSRNSDSGNGREYEAGFTHDSWNGSPFNNLKRNRDGDLKMFSNFNGLENQNGETRKSTPGLVHHLSLPKNSSAEMAEVEKFLQFQQDTVPCQIRAKRGCATHPRSIAERMRRTRISEKMKKLQDLFPNMDKQTNTADMLDLAVEYIKDLQKQVQTLSETRAKCSCSTKPQQTSPTT